MVGVGYLRFKVGTDKACIKRHWKKSKIIDKYDVKLILKINEFIY